MVIVQGVGRVFIFNSVIIFYQFNDVYFEWVLLYCLVKVILVRVKLVVLWLEL